MMNKAVYHRCRHLVIREDTSTLGELNLSFRHTYRTNSTDIECPSSSHL